MNRLLCLPVLLSASGLAHAATISYVGSIEGAVVSDWRTSATVKALDLDGDNIFGTHGAVQWGRAGLGEFGAGSATPGWHYAGETGAGQFSNAAYTQVDDVLNPAATFGGGIAAVAGTFTFEMTGIAATYSGKTLRVGIMADMLSAGEWAADINKAFQLVQVVGGAGDSGTVSLRSGGAGNGQAEMYFFDINGVNPGDTFRVVTTGNPGGQPGYVGPMSWDLYAVPEPTSAAMRGSLALLGLRRRRR